MYKQVQKNLITKLFLAVKNESYKKQKNLNVRSRHK